MINIISRFISLVLILKHQIVFLQTTGNSRNCIQSTDCFNCSYGENENNCLWSNGICQSSLNSVDSSFWWYYFSKCYDTESIEITQRYCGEQEYQLNSKNLKLALPSNGGLYGTNHIYCKYALINPEAKTFYFVSINSLIAIEEIKISIYTVFSDNSFSNVMINEPYYFFLSEIHQ